MLCVSGFELYSLWVSLLKAVKFYGSYLFTRLRRIKLGKFTNFTALFPVLPTDFP